MKWFFRISGLVFLLFAVVISAGAVLPETQIVERSRVVPAELEPTFAAVDDLSTHPAWSHLVPDDADIAFGETTGTGASAAWDDGGAVGSAEILQSVEPELVLLAVQSGADGAVLTYAFQEYAAGTLVVVKQERDLGGFPYLARVGAKLRETGLVADMDASLERLGALIPPAAPDR